MAFDPLDTGTWMAFLLIFARMAAMVFLFPFFRYRGVPILLRVWIAIIISFLLFMTLG
ncbi:MAG: flagellar biosynthetic protein FliR, partial [Firmicutes bacterium]|nr:flagellar biosynthetic protein FliR [Bacillota bacterium]